MTAFESIFKKNGVRNAAGHFPTELESKYALAVKVVELSDEHRF